ncbi:unnamed protein product [Paramecium octaurelia]|uniref:Uncharacterized protein n=1 Tax=Paramecium octaurelia TaxID=43137 RepID=A0A8S1UK68_PAROT|nr:unnamed protein product [Paramecium octaurelia]
MKNKRSSDFLDQSPVKIDRQHAILTPSSKVQSNQHSPTKDQFSQASCPFSLRDLEFQCIQQFIPLEQRQHFKYTFQKCKLLLHEERQVAIKEYDNINQMNQNDTSHGLYDQIEENQFEHDKPYEMSDESEQDQREHDSQSKLKTQTEVQHQPEVYIKDPKEFLDRFIGRHIVQNLSKEITVGEIANTIIQGVETSLGQKGQKNKEEIIEKKKNIISKYALSLFFSFAGRVIVKYGEGCNKCETIRNELGSMLIKKDNKWYNSISTYFCVRKEYQTDQNNNNNNIKGRIDELIKKIKEKTKELADKKGEEPADNQKKMMLKFSLEYDDQKKKVKLNCPSLQERFKTGKLKSQSLEVAKEKVKELEIEDKEEYDCLMKYFDLTIELKSIGKIKKSTFIYSQDIKILYKKTLMKKFFDIIKNRFLKISNNKNEQGELDELDELILEELKTMFEETDDKDQSKQEKKLKKARQKQKAQDVNE